MRLETVFDPSAPFGNMDWAVCEEGGGDVVAELYGETGRELAHLFAASPWLLEALEGLYELCPEGHKHDKTGKWAEARKAIQAAKPE